MDAQHLAIQIVQTLRNAGHIAYFAGGWVRDYLMNHPSEDIDIATTASPPEILNLFPNTIHVGIAFGVVIVPINGHQFEVATFRKDLGYEDGRKPTGIEPTSPEEDALRRDFTINGIFYDPLNDTIHDFVGGKEDITHQMIRAIGDPYERFTEDKLRMIRAVRFASRFSFHIDPETESAIAENAASLFPAVSIERVWDEFRKIIKTPQIGYAFIELHRLGLLSTIFPELEGTHLNVIKERVAPFPHYPEKTPTIAFILALFPQKTHDELVNLCHYLRTSNEQLRFAQLLIDGQQLVHQEQQGEKPPDLYDWSCYYAKPDVQRSLRIIAAPLPEKEKARFLATHEKRQNTLQRAIERIQKKRPLVDAKLLQQEGIDPSKTLGQLIEEGMRLATNHHLEDPTSVLEKLKNSPFWP